MTELPEKYASLPTIDKVNLICLILRSLPSSERFVTEDLLGELEARVRNGELSPTGQTPFHVLRAEVQEALLIARASASEE